ncbi:penicillin-binding protein 2 [Thiomicrorhabdus sediminis]|uniref:Peptidoglycan D,D-transpeptidase MrdA n=1 Tax=Thiomicrorhabdus sediminis TaxID=2580412 RepID=A0A4P9K5Z8_9GAMM|nr:penicillin-binding protein 2 [Thiomicrorhabdus sediminis]QCU89687.1 penicillin-binding protein 2 [Thiomicrorhabdus sediminis]
MAERLNFNSDEETYVTKRRFRFRLYFAYGFVLLLFAFLAGRMVQLQWLNYDRYHGLAEGNRVSVETLPPTRGKIYDRNHILLADNQPVYAIKMVREKMEDIDAFKRELMVLLDNIPAQKIEDYFNKFKRWSRSRSYTLPFSITEEQAARLAVINYKHPGVTLDARLKRIYPNKSTAVHALGYVGRINSKELKNLDEQRYRGTQIIGKSGIERFYEDRLHGSPGIQQIETNARGRILRKLETLPAQPGEDIHLTIDIELQKFGEELFGKKRGGLVAIDPQNGEILAFVSMPTFDPNLFVDGIDQENYSRLLYDPNKPFINRVINGQYPPGSTIKPFVALGAIENNYISPQKKIWDPGYFDFAEHRYRDWKRTGHGHVDMNTAIVQSCDTYFYQLSLDMGVDAIHDTMSPFGFGKKTDIDIFGESTGILPSQQWKMATKGKPWYRGETIISSIGQGFNLTTPLQLAKATAVLANRGKVIQPHLLRDQLKNQPTEQVEIKNIANWDKVIQAMEDVMHGARGTARRHGKGLPFKMAGKTGTAQVFSLNEADYDADAIDKRLHDHSLFIGFAPVDNPRIAVAVIAENAGSGSATAAPMAVNLIKKYLTREQPQTDDK